MKNTNFLLILGLIFLGVASRLFPHATNFTALGATALFAGAYLRPRWMAFAIPISILFVSDLYLGFYSSMWGVYLGFSVAVILGMLMPQGSAFSLRKVLGLAAGALGSSLSFFLISNFAVWTNDLMYPLTWQGLVQCYASAIPFFRNQLSADLIYSFALFLSYAFVTQKNAAKLQNTVLK